jgi:signal transduction histidine kinase
MAADSAVLDSASQGKQGRNPISRKQIESIFSRSVAVFGIVFGAQTLPAILDQAPQAHPVWLQTFVAAFYLSLIVALVASLLQRWVRTAFITVALVFFAGLVTWPFAVTDVTKTTSDNHWLYYLITVATAAAAVGLSTRLATIYLFVIPTVYGVIRVTPAGGNVGWELSALDAIYGIILGGAIMILCTMLRQAATSVDRAQAAALDRYAHAVRQHATEVERVQVDSIVHDSVLTTLLSAARAFTPEARELAATMAENAIGHLRVAALVGPDDGSTVTLAALAERISASAEEMNGTFELRTQDVEHQSIPTHPAEAVYSAAVQAMINSLQHAGSTGDVTRWLTIRGLSPSGIEVQIGDTGEGFSLADVPTARLGVRVSIVERVANAGGVAEIDSVPGEGTVITVRWPSPEGRTGRDLDRELLDEIGEEVP